ncbi:unnamed protein product [Closterium sp. Yama58-4]|nr:unnamed protein product [Closterium sp. Yama58-4]
MASSTVVESSDIVAWNRIGRLKYPPSSMFSPPPHRPLANRPIIARRRRDIIMPSRSTVQAGVAAVVAGVVALSLVAGTSAYTAYDTVLTFKAPMIDGKWGFIDSVCFDVSPNLFPDGSDVSIVWGGKTPFYRECNSVSFHSVPGCAGTPKATYLRPANSAPTSWALPVADFPRSVKCETGCGADNVDCGVEAKCRMIDSKAACVCTGALVFDATAKQCRAPPPSCATIVCPTNSTCNATADPPCICNEGFEMTNGQCVAPPPSCATIVCPTNSTCNATADPPCICNKGLTMTDGQCVAPPPSCATIVCPTNSTCNATADPPCICNKGLTMTDGQCLAVCKRACARNAECALVGNKPACRCKAGYGSVKWENREWEKHQQRGQ